MYVETSKERHQPTSSQNPRSLSCEGCSNESSRKAAITCSLCRQRWHTTCARLTIAQAQALSVWNCPQCLGRPVATLPSPADANKDPIQDFAAGLAKLRTRTRVISHIPKAARPTIADALSSLINEALQSPTSPLSWWKFLSFAFVALRAPSSPKNGEKRLTLVTHLKRQAAELSSSTPIPPPPETEQRSESSQDSERAGALARRIQAKIADGDIRAGLRLLTSSDTFVQPTADVISALRQKHPSAPSDESLPPPPATSDPPPLSATEEEVRVAILTMRRGSSAGLDGIRPLHLHELLSREAAESGRRLLTSLTALTNLVLGGLVPKCGRDALFGASLCALRKKDGGLRPIAVGSVYRRLAGRIGAKHISTILGPELRPTQLGVGTPLGCEAAVHAVREYINADATNSADSPRVLVKIDVRNAFNTIRRDVILTRIQERCPELYPMAYQAYHLPSPLHIGDQTILSSSGVQQGDPLGPAAFALGVDACARSVQSPLNIWYLDDATIAGPADVVQADLKSLAKALPKLGLQLNTAKCEVTIINDVPQSARDAAVHGIRSALPEIKETPLDSAALLGSPLGSNSTATAVDNTTETIQLLCNRIKDLDSHTALFFLVNYVSAPRLIYLLRSAPLVSASSKLKNIDKMVRETLVEVSNVEVNGEAWEQAKLPIRLGGLGVRSVEDLALPCYIASLHAALPLLRSISPGLIPDDSAPFSLQTAIQQFSEVTGIQDVPPTSTASSQRSWDNLAATVSRDRMVTSANQLHRARLVAASEPHTAAWLQAVPVPSLGLHLDEETVRVAVALRLGATVCERHQCRLCGRQVDELGHHGLSCVKSAGRLPRHAHLNEVVRRGLASAGIPAILEPVGLDRDGKRPDGLTLFPYHGGQCLTWDATCSDTFADSMLIQTALQPGAAARAAETRKRRLYSEIGSRYIFTPVAIETSGVLGPDTANFISELGHRITARTGERREAAWLRQRLSIALVRGNAAAVLATAATARKPISSQNSRSALGARGP
jgi:hypothetical protein